MQFKNWGEDKFIAYLRQQFPAFSPLEGIGDDCAVIPWGHKKAWLITTDALVEGIHFLKNQISPQDLGYKTIAVNVSDIVAMGGIPKYAFLALALPKKIKRNWVGKLTEGIKEACEQWKLQLLGGDTVGSLRDIFLSLAMVGTAQKNQIKYRRRAMPGDVICVTDFLGDSGGGLKALQEKLKPKGDIVYLMQRHFRPEPNPKLGRWLASFSEVHAMMDISDGLSCDLKRLIESSSVGAFIELSQIPISAALARACEAQRWNAYQVALNGGEDYCLLFTVAPEKLENLQKAYQKAFDRPFFPIGYVSASQKLFYLNHGKATKMKYAPFDHFQ